MSFYVDINRCMRSHLKMFRKLISSFGVFDQYISVTGSSFSTSDYIWSCVPCQVPFRLTRDIIDGMGVSGVEGVFRRCCEATLSVMRTNKDALLTIIEVRFNQMPIGQNCSIKCGNHCERTHRFIQLYLLLTHQAQSVSFCRRSRTVYLLCFG